MPIILVPADADKWLWAFFVLRRMPIIGTDVLRRCRMALKLKLDGDGKVVVLDGKPVYLDDVDNKELAFDAEQMHAKITALNTENRVHRTKAEDLTKQLAKFGDASPDDVNDFLTTLEDLGGPDGIAELKAKGKVDVEAIKRSISESYEGKLAEAAKSIEVLTARERQLLIGNGFASSQFLAKQTNMLPDVAEAYFGKHFKVEKGAPVAYLGDNMIFSRERAGEPASIDEALTVLINQHPQKDRILLAPGGGSGAPGSGSANGLPANLANLSPTDRITAARGAGIKT
jgi:hypothetical protein